MVQPPEFVCPLSEAKFCKILQVNIRWKALAEIYTMHSFAPFWNPLAKNGAPFSNLNFFVKNRQNFFAIELMNIH